MRPLLHLFTALLTALAILSPANAGALLERDGAYLAKDGALRAPKQINHASRRHYTASLEEFFVLDDDAEQYFKPPPIVNNLPASFVLVGNSRISCHRAACPSHRACAFYPTGPPRA